MALSEENATLYERLEKLETYLRKAKRIVFLTGAGMSTDSGIPDFRSPGGLYNIMASADVFDLNSFQTNPEHFYQAFAPLYQRILKAKPNAGHLAIAKLEKLSTKEIEVVTQNIDTLHSRAGSSKVDEIHGTLRTLTCQKCHKQFDSHLFDDRLVAGKILYCDCGGILKPDVTFFGEELPLRAFYAAEGAMFNAQLLVVLGTSMTVYPAAGLPRNCPGGVPFVIINRAPTPFDPQGDLIFRESISEILPKVIDSVTYL